jgi:hypothetical protein
LFSLFTEQFHDSAKFSQPCMRWLLIFKEPSISFAASHVIIVEKMQAYDVMFAVQYWFQYLEKAKTTEMEMEFKKCSLFSKGGKC